MINDRQLYTETGSCTWSSLCCFLTWACVWISSHVSVFICKTGRWIPAPPGGAKIMWNNLDKNTECDAWHMVSKLLLLRLSERGSYRPKIGWLERWKQKYCSKRGVNAAWKIVVEWMSHKQGNEGEVLNQMLAGFCLPQESSVRAGYLSGKGPGFSVYKVAWGQALGLLHYYNPVLGTVSGHKNPKTKQTPTI